MSDLHDFMSAARTLVHVYRVPEKLNDGYCFGGGKQIAFTNVDWFEAAVSEGKDILTKFIKRKSYYTPKARFLVLGNDPNFVFTIEPTSDVLPFKPIRES